LKRVISLEIKALRDVTRVSFPPCKQAITVLHRVDPTVDAAPVRTQRQARGSVPLDGPIMNKEQLRMDAADNDRVNRDAQRQAELLQIQDALRGLRFGAVSVIVQDGVVVQIERTEKRRIRRGTSDGPKTP